jgi:hypothetical protein
VLRLIGQERSGGTFNKPETLVEDVEELLGEPTYCCHVGQSGFGGQSFMPVAFEKA